MSEKEESLINSNNQTNKSHKIKLLTYNFFLRPPPIKTNEDDYKDERLNDFKDYMKDFDIICMQEVFGSFSGRKKKMIYNAKKNGFNFYATGNMPPFFSKFLIDGGLLTLSRFPIIECKKINYDYGVMSDGMSMKGVIYTKIRINNNFLCLFNTHLQASYYDSGVELWNSCISSRSRQCETLINFIYACILKIPISERDKCLFILCGDFNMDGGNYNEFLNKYNLPVLNESEIDTFQKKLAKLGDIVNLTIKKFGKYPPTYGINTEGYDQVLTDPVDIKSNQTLDYMFEIKPDFSKSIYQSQNKQLFVDTSSDKLLNDKIKDNETDVNSNTDLNNKLIVDYDSTKVEPFTIENRKYQQLSDHFGLSTEFIIENK